MGSLLSWATSGRLWGRRFTKSDWCTPVLTVDRAATVGWSRWPGPGIPITGHCYTCDFNGDRETGLACYPGKQRKLEYSSSGGWRIGVPEPERNFPPDEWNVVPVSGRRRQRCSLLLGACGVWSVALTSGTGWWSFWLGLKKESDGKTKECWKNEADR